MTNFNYITNFNTVNREQVKYVVLESANKLEAGYPQIVKHVKIKNLDTVKNQEELTNAIDNLKNFIKKFESFEDGKIALEKIVLTATESGQIEWTYDENHLVSVEKAAELFGVSKPTVYKYTEKGLEFVEINNVKKIPISAIEAWQDPSKAFELQWLFQEKQLRNETLQQKYDRIQKEISEFEKDFGGEYQELYGDMTEKEIDELDEAIDVKDWKELIKLKKSILEKIKTE